MTKSQKPELLPCPFCGSPAKVINLTDAPGMQPACNNWAAMCGNHRCSAMIDIHRSQHQLTQAWNTRADGWLPIESAPKDVEILVSGGTYDWDESWNTTGLKLKHVAKVSWRSGLEDGWCGDNTGGHDTFFWYQPTHWMPLPEPPKVDE